MALMENEKLRPKKATPGYNEVQALVGIENDPDRAVWGFTGDQIIPVEDELLVNLEGSSPSAIKVYKKILADQSVSSVNSKIVQEICGRDWKVSPYVESGEEEPTSQAKEVADTVTKQLEIIKLDDLTCIMMEAVITGIATVEVKFKRTRQGAELSGFSYINPRRIQFNTKWEPYLITKDNSHPGVPLAKYPRNFIIHRFYAFPTDSPYGQGLGKILYHPVLFLRRAMESWLLAADRYATPLPVVKTPMDATPLEKMQVFRSMVNLSREKALLVPNSWEIEFIQPTANADFYEKQVALYSSMISKIIAGEMTTGEDTDVGGYSRDKVSKSILTMRAKWMSQKLDETLNDTLIRWIVDINFGVNVPAPRYHRNFSDINDVLPVSELTSLIASGFEVDPTWVSETYNFELAKQEKEEQETNAWGQTIGQIQDPFSQLDYE